MNELIYANFNTTISKLINPTIYDNLIDTNGHVSKDLLVIYQNLSKQDNYPILQYIGQEMLQFINNQPNNIVYQDYNSDKLSSNASIIYKKVHKLLNELYTSHNSDITVYIPENIDINVNTNNGGLYINGVNANNLNFNTQYGNISLSENSNIKI